MIIYSTNVPPSLRNGRELAGAGSSGSIRLSSNSGVGSDYLKLYSSTQQAVKSDIAVDGVVSATSISENGVLLATKYITPAGVDVKINALINAAPTTLDTLKELAAALGNDPNFATTITNLIGTKAPLESPNFTGLPTVGGNTILHAGNFNKVDVAVQGSTLTAAAGSVIIKGYDYPQLQFMKLDGSFRLLFRAGNDIRWRYDGTNDGNIFHSGNSNINSVAWTCSMLNASSAIISGTITGMSAIISNSALTDANSTIIGNLPVGMRFDRGNSVFINTPTPVNNANGLLTLTSHPVGAAGTYGKQLFFTDNEELYVRRFSNGVASSWRNIWHSGNANLPKVDWNVRNLILGGTNITFPTQAGKTPYIGQYAADGSLIISIEGTGTDKGLVLGGTSGNLLYKGNIVWHSGNSNLSTVNWNANALYSKFVDITGGTGLITENGFVNYQNSRARTGYSGTLQGLLLATADTGKPIVFSLDILGATEKVRINNNGLTVTNGVVRSSDFNGSGFTAVGWQIGDYSNLNNLDVRSRLQVYEFVQSKINISNGNLIVTDSAKCDIVLDLRPTYNTIRFKFTDAHPFNVGDVVRCKSRGKDYAAYINWISPDRLIAETYGSVSLGGQSLDEIKNAGAADGDLLVRWNSSDANRKGLLYLNSSDSNSPNFQVIYNNTPKAVLGNIAGLNWKGTAIAANKYGVWADGDIYINNGYFAGEVNVTGGNAETVTGAQTKADAALSAANYQLTLLNNSLGSLAYKSAVSTAMLDNSVIVGGYIKTSLLDVTSIIVSGGIAKTTDLTTTIGNKFTYIDSSGVYTGTLTANQVKATNAVFGTANISDAAITQVKIVDAAITTAKITDAAITGAKIASASITNAKIADLAVTGAKIASATITDANIFSLNADKIVAGKIKAQYIESDKITALGAITAASFNLGNGAFSVSTEGILTAIGATIKGSITADSGKISGFALANNTITATGASNEVLLNSNEGFLKITGVSQAVGNYYSQLGVKALEGENQSLLGAYTAGYFSIGSAPAANKNIALYAKGTFINGYNAAIYATGRIITDQSVYDWGYNDEIAVLPATITLHVTENLKYLIGHGFSGQTLIYQLPRLSEIQNSLFATNDENFMITLKIIVKHDSGNVAINPSLDYPLYNNNGTSISGQSLSRGDSVDVTIIKQNGSVWAQFNGYAF